MMDPMMDMLAHDTGIWVAFSFILFAVLAYRLGKHSVVSMLDKRIDDIRRDIETAQNLRTEAQGLLDDYKTRQQDAQAEAARILKQAQENAARLQVQAEAELTEIMSRREAQLAERLARLEKNAIAEIQSHAAELAVKATTEIILKTLDERTNKTLIDESVKNLPKHLN